MGGKGSICSTSLAAHSNVTWQRNPNETGLGTHRAWSVSVTLRRCRMLAFALFIAVWLGLTSFLWVAFTRTRAGGTKWWTWLGNGSHTFWKVVLLGAMTLVPSMGVALLLSWLVSLVVWPLWLLIATLVLFIAAAITLPLVSRSGAGWPWWPARFPRVLAGLAMAAVGALVLGIVVSALVFRVPWGRLTAGIDLPRIEMPAAAGATETPEVVERVVVEAQCPEPLEKYNAPIARGEMNCPIEGSIESVKPGQDRTVNGMLLSCEICGGKPHLVVKGYATPPAAPEVGKTGTYTETAWVAHKLPVAELQSMLDNTSKDKFADTMVALIGEHCDEGGVCPRASDGGWRVDGPAIIMTDPTGLKVEGAQVFKTYEMKAGRYGAYYCADNCVVPTPGRAAILEGPWTGEVITPPASTETPQPTAAAPTTQVAPKLAVADLQKMLTATNGDQTADSLVNKIAEFCDTGDCPGHDVAFNVNGPALIMLDPGGKDIPNASVIKTLEGKPGRFGVYYCASSCAVPSAGREVKLQGPLP